MRSSALDTPRRVRKVWLSIMIVLLLSIATLFVPIPMTVTAASQCAKNAASAPCVVRSETQWVPLYRLVWPSKMAS